MGRHSGYDRLCDALDAGAEGWVFDDVYRVPAPNDPIRRRYYTYRAAAYADSPNYEASSFLLEREVLRTVRRARPDLVHLMYLEKDLGMLAERKSELGCPLVATTHQPRSWWKLIHRRPEVVRSLDGLIVLTEREADYWSGILPGRVHLAPHGIDVGFFCPSSGAEPGETAPRCIVVGHWLRDFETLNSAVGRLARMRPELGFDIVLPFEARSIATQFGLARHDSVRFHAGLSDEHLRDLYRRSALLLLPLLDATANNALLEAMACGLPIVTTDLDGIRTYLDPSFADLVPPDDVDAVVDSVVRLVESAEERTRRSKAARAHAENHLSWERVFWRVLEAYQGALSSVG